MMQRIKTHMDAILFIYRIALLVVFAFVGVYVIYQCLNGLAYREVLMSCLSLFGVLVAIAILFGAIGRFATEGGSSEKPRTAEEKMQK